MRYWFTTLMLIITANVSFGQEKRMAVVETSTCYMRIAPDYESALETQELMGTVVEIVGESGYWREIVSPQPYKAWTTEKTLVEMSEEEIREYEAAPKYMFTELYGHIYSEPSEKAQTICDLVGGDVLRVSLNTGNSGQRRKSITKTSGDIEDEGESATIGNQTSQEGRPSKTTEKQVEKMAVTKGKWAQVVLPSGVKGWVLKSQVRVLGERVNIKKGDTAEGLISNEQMEAIIASAEQLIGVPYLWGGMTSKGVDCSGLVRISAILNDVLLPRNASQMIFCGTPVEMNCNPIFWNEEYRTAGDGKYQMEFIEEMNGRVRNLQRGDLVFFGTPATDEKPMRVTHVGIYLGNNRIIHSSHKVRINSLIPGQKDYYENSHRLLNARRFIGR